MRHSDCIRVSERELEMEPDLEITCIDELERTFRLAGLRVVGSRLESLGNGVVKVIVDAEDDDEDEEDTEDEDDT